MRGRWMAWAGFHGFLAVAMGAFAAHLLKDKLDEQALRWIETGARYEAYHALALLGLSGLSGNFGKSMENFCGWGWALGALLFSGSLYAMAFTGLRPLGAITPLGGICQLSAWACLAYAGWKNLRN